MEPPMMAAWGGGEGTGGFASELASGLTLRNGRGYEKPSLGKTQSAGEGLSSAGN